VKQSQFWESQMKLTVAKLRCYKNRGFEKQSQNKPNSKPIKANSNPISAQNKPKQTQPVVSLSNLFQSQATVIAAVAFGLVVMITLLKNPGQSLNISPSGIRSENA